ncbi:hypothetical protein [Candidatus Electronema sp. TJ]
MRIFLAKKTRARRETPQRSKKTPGKSNGTSKNDRNAIHHDQHQQR